MENPIQIFNHEQFGSLTTFIQDDGKVLFKAKDVAKALGYANTNDAIIKHCKGTREMRCPSKNQFGTIVYQITKFIPESDVFRLIMRSKLPMAEAYQDWVCEEVLPSIHKTGGYIMVRQGESPEDIQARALRVADHAMKVLEEKNEALICEVERQQGQIEDLKVRTVYQRVIENSPGLLTPTQIAKDYGMSGKKFNKILHELGIQYFQSGQWLLYAKYQDYGYTKSVTYLGNDGETYAHTKWTQKGRFFLYKALRNECILPLCEIM